VRVALTLRGRPTYVVTMSIFVRRIGLVVFAGLVACVVDTGDDDGAGDTQGSGDSSTAAVDSGLTMTATTPGDASSGGGDDEEAGDISSGDPSASDTSTGGGESSDGADMESGGSDETAGEVMYDPEFVWIADFLRMNCASCHATSMNGNLVLMSPDIDNEEVRIALEGVMATTGLLLVEPGDRNASQTYLQITNEFGAIFPVVDTDRFGAWIDAGAMYYAQ
jgi:hypothetical protein